MCSFLNHLVAIVSVLRRGSIRVPFDLGRNELQTFSLAGTGDTYHVLEIVHGSKRRLEEGQRLQKHPSCSRS